MTTEATQTHTIDASGKKLGRIASDIAMILMGKNTTVYARNKTPDVRVVVENASKLEITEKKKEEKTYTSHSGYPGGLKKTPMNRVISKKGYAELLRKAVYGMLPGNKLRDPAMKRMTINE